jgi:16S rRNA (guanine527-N7)-methyltransferase
MKILTEYFPDLSQKQIEQFTALENLYNEWNKKVNVISRKDMDNFYEHHVLHSLAIAKIFTFPDEYEVMDLGTGGGFPGITLAIYFPHVKFHLVDSVNKKLTVVTNVSDTIGLNNVTIQHSRAEDLHNKKFDVIVSRAVAPLKDLLRWSKPLLKPAATNNRVTGLICLKGGNLAQEIAESKCNVQMYDIDKLFEEGFFKDKYILQALP